MVHMVGCEPITHRTSASWLLSAHVAQFASLLTFTTKVRARIRRRRQRRQVSLRCQMSIDRSLRCRICMCAVCCVVYQLVTTGFNPFSSLNLADLRYFLGSIRDRSSIVGVTTTNGVFFFAAAPRERPHYRFHGPFIRSRLAIHRAPRRGCSGRT